MKLNPVYKRETTVSSRSFRLALILAIFNTILALVVLLNMYSVVERVKLTAEIQYSSFTNLYVFVAAVEFVMLMFIMPALTAGGISGERERQTLDLLLTTTLKPWEMGDYMGEVYLFLWNHVPYDHVQLSPSVRILCIWGRDDSRCIYSAFVLSGCGLSLRKYGNLFFHPV